MKKTMFTLPMVVVLATGMLTACGSNTGNNESATNSPAATNAASPAASAAATASGDKKPSGSITVLTQRTDIVDTLQNEFTAEFNKVYPDIKVKWEAVQDYENNIKIRMNTSDYGDVLLIPNNVEPKDFPNFFEPLGDYEADKAKYSQIDAHRFEGKYYGLPMAINTLGIVYNKKVFKDAGVTEVPKTPEQFLAAMHKIKDNTKAVPLYTNYKDDWTLSQWADYLQPASGDPNYPNLGVLQDPHPWAPGKPFNDIFKLMYDVAKQGLIEEDPTTTDWESSKGMLNRGEIGTMVLGSWAITQMQGAGPNPQDIGYMPFPTNAAKLSAPLAADYNWSINVHSKNKEAANAFIHWVVDTSDYASKYQGGFSAKLPLQIPELLKGFQDLGVTMEVSTPGPDDLNGILTKIDNDSEVGIHNPDFKKRLIESAIGNRDESFEDIMKDLDTRWNKSWEKLIPANYKK
ncbi:ABC transporter substrate-binding protein [Paenibacillus hexagrammi]|uniref:Extracellular solute-binding protein n=1 Tax=Paenibacillus hexagrammi TaxID=2908839 RepID=A0ABY3SBP6_9BACL|nr:extracellular solute-binding protein [Paenibacillus sp. YPD9-1]UJF31379.1 extracellular solute-binding protein [Paenibacillus sp. YPD9-1]